MRRLPPPSDSNANVATRVESGVARRAAEARPKTTAVDANARFLAAAAARAAARKPRVKIRPRQRAERDRERERLLGRGARRVGRAVKSCLGGWRRKKRREAERGATPEDDDPALTTKTMRVKTEDAEELEIKYSVKVPEARLAELKERRRRQLEARDEAAKESAKEAAKEDETSAKAETNANEAPEEAETPPDAEPNPNPNPNPAEDAPAEDASAKKRPRRSTRG